VRLTDDARDRAALEVLGPLTVYIIFRYVLFYLNLIAGLYSYSADSGRLGKKGVMSLPLIAKGHHIF
jgi:hypothetical protein